MNVLIINTYSHGGAANACIRLHEGLLDSGVNSKLLFKVKLKNVRESYSFQETQIPYPVFKRKYYKWRYIILDLLPQRFRKYFLSQEYYLKQRPSNLEHFSFPTSNFDLTRNILYEEADIINLHWVAEFLNFQTFFTKNKKPLVWTLHDMNPFTGGEHYEEEFSGIDESDTLKPRIINLDDKSFYESIVNDKIKALKETTRLTVVAPSNWLCNEAKKSRVLGRFETYRIPYGLDQKVFRQYDKQVARDVLNIKTEKSVILFVSDKIDSERKGIKILLRSLRLINQENHLLCIAGDVKDLDLDDFQCETHLLGHIKDDRIMSLCYNAADVFIIPSLMDNLPNTVLESLMCGTPVIGFAIGGIPDMIIDEENGILVKHISPQNLAKAISEFFLNANTFDRESISQKAIEKYSLEIQAASYVKLYNRVENEI
ncbi:Glycosyltransferase involved in cell wall bisynthesis [Nonlabens sp. Hel1_33_55]|nr:Glycosyltransferase involved in cell wall bisynthesis [Nonlabens sp. Hel1_33_55]